jgi:hypothetical protein
MSRAGVYLVTVKVRGKARVIKVQAENAEDAESKIAHEVLNLVPGSEVIDVRFHGGSR